MANNNRRNRRRKQKRKIMRSLTINEMSGVDVPAQEGAEALILKRADSIAESPEAFVNMVKAEDLGGVMSTLTNTSGYEHASAAIANVPFETGYIAPQMSTGLQWSNGTMFKFEPDPDQELVEKLMMLTSSEDDHQHAIRLDRWALEEMGGSTSYQGGDGDSHHSHDFVINADGSIEIGEANGHTHTVEMSILQQLQTVFSEKSADGGDEEDEEKRGKKKPGYSRKSSTGGDPNPSKTEKQMDEKEVQALVDAAIAKSKEESDAELAKARKFGELTDGQKAHFNELDEVAKDAFLELSPEQRQAAVDDAIAKRESANPVVYTTDDGIELRKSHDPIMVQFAKDRDADRKELAKLRGQSETASLEKRAGELEYLPGTVEDKIEMLKAIDAIPNEEARNRSLEALKAQNTDMAKAFETHGVRPGNVDPTTPNSAEAQLDTLAKNYAKEHNVDEASAYAAVMETPEGAKLYNESVAN